MLLGELTDAMPINDQLLFRVIGRTISMETKAVDSGVKIKLFVQNHAIMYYFLNYFNRNTRHAFTGSLSASAFTFDDSQRAFVNLRLSVDAVRPILSVDEENNVIPTRAIRMRAREYENLPSNKLKYQIFKFVWFHIDNENVVQQKGLNREIFANYVSDFHEELCETGVIPDGAEFNPVKVSERIVRQARQRTGAGSRPGLKIRELEYVWNPLVPPVDWEHPSLSLANLTRENIPFHRDTIRVSGDGNGEPQFGEAMNDY